MALKHKDIEKLFKVTSSRRIRLKTSIPGPRERKASSRHARANTRTSAHRGAGVRGLTTCWSSCRQWTAPATQSRDGRRQSAGLPGVLVQEAVGRGVSANFLALHEALPERGAIGIFNRFHYANAGDLEPSSTRRCRRIAGQEHLEGALRRHQRVRTSSRITAQTLKFFPHVQKEQRRRFIAPRQPDTRSSPRRRRAATLGLHSRRRDAINQTSTKWAPW